MVTTAVVQAMVGEDLSQIGHGADALMARNMQLAPNSMATTSTGLNYLLGEDNDTVRVPYNEGNMVLPKPKPAQSPLVELSRIYKTYEDAMPGVSKDTQKYLQQDFIQKLQDAGISQEAFMTYKMQNNFADGGRIGYEDGEIVLPEPKPKLSSKSDFEKKISTIEKAKNINKLYQLGKTGKISSLFSLNPYAIGLTGLLSLNKNRKDKQKLADGGIAGLRKGYAGGKGVDIARRGFLKFLGGTAAGVVALKTGLAKMFGKESGAISKKAIDEVIIEGGSGAPAWLQPLVNKALREGTDISKQAVKDGQVVKSLDTPTGKVDVYYDTRTGEIDIDYIGGNTALGESVNMRYVPGVADEGTKGVKPMDEFEANEAIPEGRGYSYGDEYDYSIDVGENTTDNVKNLFSDTTELAELGGQKTLTKDIVETVKKKKVLKQMEDNPADFITDVQGDFVPD